MCPSAWSQLWVQTKPATNKTITMREKSVENHRMTGYRSGFREAGWEHPPPGGYLQHCQAVSTVFILN